ncbi:DEAD/DEAH box helicase [Bilophila sp.]|uniref:DEAD/DEAH box helicase n=1 Tax=Bilophila sp. TaxID=1929485 RepID=UPI00257AE356|nr:DEAD/DEAH box helicase [Bilophila sp.]MBS5453907.1 DEAD/DEAH box helicase [Bilophila sp.]
MFDSETSKLLSSAPALSGLDSNNFPLFFTRQYAELSMARLRGYHEVDEESPVRWTLDKIADAYELIASLNTNPQIQKSSAFVAATAHQILSRRIKSVEDSFFSINIGITQFGIAPSISSALLFMIAEQYADAHESAQSINTVDDNIYEARILTEHIKDLCTGKLNSILKRGERWRIERSRTISLHTHALKALFETLISGIEILAGKVLNKRLPQKLTQDFGSAQEAFEKVINLSLFRPETGLEFLSNSVLSSFPGPRHIAKLLLSISGTLVQAALADIPPPEDADKEFWSSWLDHRANHFPYLWPNHKDAVKQAFYHPGISAVLVLPTGAGKTTLSALKIASTLARKKKVLFLAPTHALVEQMTVDLQAMFPKELCSTVVTSAYDNLFIMDSPLQDIEVMTPERCLSMISFAPEIFTDVGLLVFDECHLLSPDKHNLRRSIDGMLCILAFNSAVPDADMLFLSAMLKNGELFSKWIESITSRDTCYIDLLWKPSRQARGVVVYEQKELNECKEFANSAQAQANRVASKRHKGLCTKANKLLKAHPVALWGLQHNWLGDNKVHVSYTDILDEPVPLSGKLSKWGIKLTPNANQVASKIAASAALHGLKTIVFVNAKSHAVSTADNISKLVNRKITLTDAELRLWEAVQAELGGPEYSFLSPGNASVPHNSAMLRQERQLAESMFRRTDGADVIVATPTLAQGLNLPAHLAILAGDVRANVKTGEREKLAAHEILNAAARAGRAGHLANGLVLLIPEPLLSFKDDKEKPSVDLIKKLESILPNDDRCLNISDPLEIILDKISQAHWNNADVIYTINRMSDWIFESGQPLFNIKKSFADYCAAARGLQQDFDKKVDLLTAAVEEHQELIFDYRLLTLASQSGISAQLLTRLQMKLIEVLDNPPSSVHEWIQWLFEWLMADDEARAYLLAEASRDIMTISGQEKDARVNPAALKIILPGVLGWTSGLPLCAIEKLILSAAEITTKNLGSCDRARKLTNSIIPRSLTFIFGVVSQLVKNCLPSESQELLDLRTIEALSSAIRQGYDSWEKLAFANDDNSVALSRVQTHERWEEARERELRRGGETD